MLYKAKPIDCLADNIKHELGHLIRIGCLLQPHGSFTNADHIHGRDVRLGSGIPQAKQHRDRDNENNMRNFDGTPYSQDRYGDQLGNEGVHKQTYENSQRRTQGHMIFDSGRHAYGGKVGNTSAVGNAYESGREYNEANNSRNQFNELSQRDLMELSSMLEQDMEQRKKTHGAVKRNQGCRKRKQDCRKREQSGERNNRYDKKYEGLSRKRHYDSDKIDTSYRKKRETLF